MPRSYAIYACYIGDGYVDTEPPTEYDPGNMREETDGYWYTPRHTEGACPCTYRGDDDTAHPDCPACGGDGTVSGEPFTVARYAFASEDDANACAAELDDAGDGYERNTVLRRWVDAGRAVETDVVDWTPDYLEEYAAAVKAGVYVVRPAEYDGE